MSSDTVNPACPTCVKYGFTFGCIDQEHYIPRCGSCGRLAGVISAPCVSCPDYRDDVEHRFGFPDDAAERLGVLKDASITIEGTFDKDAPVLEFLGQGLSVEKPGGALQKWADVAMWQATEDPMAARGELVRPQVTLLSMTPRPLQTMAAAAALYRGEIVRDVASVSIEEATHWLMQAIKSRGSQSMLEFVDCHFLIEGVTRAFTHQLVRQRVGASYVQESMRFAVKGNAEHEVAMPPYIEDLAEDHPMRIIWMQQMRSNSWVYNALVDGGVPAEDARGILPTNITTRIHYKTTLRGLVDHAGLRLCSQAQYEWKEVWSNILTAMDLYGPREDRWQQRAITSLFRPVCYHTGKCEFLGDHDRFCPIRERVMAHHSKGQPPSQWGDIDHLEPLRYGAARVSPDIAQ